MKSYFPIRRVNRFFNRLLDLDPEDYRPLLVKFFGVLALPFLAGFAVSDLLRGAPAQGIVTFLVFILLAVTVLLIDRVKSKSTFYRINLLLLILNFVFVIYADPDVQVSTMWMYIMPLPITIFLGSREGVIWILLSLVAAVTASQFPVNHVLISFDFMIRFIVIYSIIGSLSLIVEIFRAKAYDLFIQQRNELVELNRELYENSIKDSLTNFYNRSFLTDPFEKIIAQAQRTRNPLTIVMIDIDNFKRINDRCGHLVGDQALVQISQVIRSMLKRGSDFVIRYGGDEFLLILPDTSLEAARIFANQIQKRIGETHFKDCQFEITISFGLAELLEVSQANPGTTDHKMRTAVFPKAVRLP